MSWAGKLPRILQFTIIRFITFPASTTLNAGWCSCRIAADRHRFSLEERASGKLIQLTDRPDLNEWSIHPSHDGRFVYFTAGALRVAHKHGNPARANPRQLRHPAAIKETGMVGAAMGTTALSRDDRWWAIPARFGAISRLIIVDTNSGKPKTIYNATRLVIRNSIPMTPACSVTRAFITTASGSSVGTALGTG